MVSSLCSCFRLGYFIGEFEPATIWIATLMQAQNKWPRRSANDLKMEETYISDKIIDNNQFILFKYPLGDEWRGEWLEMLF